MRRRSKAAGCFLLVGIAAGAQEANVPGRSRVRMNVRERGENASKVKTDAVQEPRVELGKHLRKQKMELAGPEGNVAARQ